MLHQDQINTTDNNFLKTHFEEIKEAITESWQQKTEDSFYITYNEVQNRVEVKLPGNNAFCYYKEKHHDTMESFLDDLNTDICILEIMKKYPTLGIEGCSWPENKLYVEFGILNNLDSFFSPKDGIFHINKFLVEKAKNLPRPNPAGMFTARGTRGARGVDNLESSIHSQGVENAQPIYPETYQSDLFVQAKPVLKK